MPMLFNEVMKRARVESLYPHLKDFANAAGISVGGYTKWETGARIPSQQMLNKVLSQGLITEVRETEVREAWRSARAVQAGLGTPSKDVDVSKVLSQLDRELLVILRKYASDSAMEHRQIAKTFKKRAGIILRTALET